MKTVQEIYSEYKIMPNLQEHQLRVAAVAKIIAENFNGNLDVESIVTACLFHDMGNIIKSDLARFPEFVEEKGIEYWQGVKDEFVQKYGPDESVATKIIAKAIGLNAKATECLNHIGFSNLSRNEKGNSFENKICNYSDMRVGPHGIISLEERYIDGHKRYSGSKHMVASEKYEELAQSGRMIENQIFETASIRPEEITDEKIKNLMEELRNKVIN